MRKHPVVVCDSSPLILLAKLDCLDLICRIVEGEIHLLNTVVDELFAKTDEPEHLERLQIFLEESKVVDFKADKLSPSKLSTADFSSLQYCLKSKAKLLLADERLLRRIAIEHGIQVMGCLGILLAAHDQKIRPKRWVKQKVDEAITSHDLRIGVNLYGKIMKALK